MKKILLTMIILVCCSVIFTITRQKVVEEDDNVKIKVSCSYNEKNKQIIVEGTFKNISDSTIFVDKYENGKWKIDEDLYLYYPKLYFPASLPPNSIIKSWESNNYPILYELKPKQFISFKIKLRSGEDDYDYPIIYGFDMVFYYYTYSPYLEVFFKGDKKSKNARTIRDINENFREIKAKINFDQN